MAGPELRTDIVDVYVFRRSTKGGAPAHGVQFLQLRRVGGALDKTWQPVMGHIQPNETATRAALRELHEETRYARGHGLIGFWQLETVNTYFLAAKDVVMLSPCFAAEVEPGVVPCLNREHDAARWVPRDRVDQAFLWPGQRAALQEVVRDILANPRDAAPSVADRLRIDLDQTGFA